MFNFFTKNYASKNRIIEEWIYELVAEELNKGEKRIGLWTKAVGMCDGDMNRAESIYIQLRANSIYDEAKITKEAEDISRKQQEKTEINRISKFKAQEKQRKQEDLMMQHQQQIQLKNQEIKRKQEDLVRQQQKTKLRHQEKQSKKEDSVEQQKKPELRSQEVIADLNSAILNSDIVLVSRICNSRDIVNIDISLFIEFSELCREKEITDELKKTFKRLYSDQA
jgi:hypothetical protein